MSIHRCEDEGMEGDHIWLESIFGTTLKFGLEKVVAPV
jgi:hypothetical protein